MSTYGSLIVGWRLHERHVVVVGGNHIAANRAEFALDAQPAKVTVICPREELSSKRLSKLVSNGIVCHVDREFAEDDLDDSTAGLVLTAVDDPKLSERIASAARKRHIPINVAEIPQLCDFLFMPTYKDSHVQVAISTNTSSAVGGVPLIANKLRQRIIDSLPEPEAVASAVSNLAVLKANLGNNSAEQLTKITESMEFEKLANLSEGKIRELVSTRRPASRHDTDDASVSSGSTVVLGESDGKLIKSNIEDILVVPDGAELNAGGVRLVDGKTAVAYIVYAVSDSIFVYPTTRSHYIGEATERWASRNVRNLSGHVGQVMRMETRSNAVTALTGAISVKTIEGARQLVGSALATSQSIIAMAPTLHMASQAQIPLSVHVAAYGSDHEMTEVADYQGVFDLREMGVSIVGSHSAQEAHDLALICHLASIATQSPFLHVFDGVRTANEFTKVKMLSYSDIARILKDCQNSASVKSVSPADVFENIAEKVGKITGRKCRSFEYVGAKNAESLLVVFSGEVGIVRDTIERLRRAGNKVGAVIVKVLRPWSDERFLAAIPKSVKRIAVLEPVHHMTDTHASPFFSDVVASYRAATGSAKLRPQLVNAAYVSSMHFNARTVVSILHQLASSGVINYSDEPPSRLSVVSSSIQQAIFWDAEAAGTVQTAQHVAEVLARDATVNVASLSSYDLYDNGGVANTLLRYGTGSLAGSFDEMNGADYIMIHDASLVTKYDTLASAKEGTIVLLNTSMTVDDLETKLDNDFKYEAAKRNIRLYIIDVDSVLQQLSTGQEARNMVLQAAFLRLHEGVELDKGKVYEVAAQYDSFGEQDITRVVREVFDQTENALTRVEIPPTWPILEKTDRVLPNTIRCNSFGPNLDLPVTEKPKTGTWHTAARHLLFKEAFGVEGKTRPDLPEETFVIHVSENRQLTPPSYDRYLFHIEFDTTGTDLKYDLGEALGVHGHNDTDEVNEFLGHYGVDPDKVISVVSKDGTKLESRTAFQLFSQVLDVFGRPAKRFYEALARYATDENEKNKLLWLVTSEGAVEFKQRVEDTITYADILYEFTSARPPVEDLVQLIAPIKPRHYSIASAQSVHPNSVHLLVVTVDWKTTTGKTRFGQCTRYLKHLNVGGKVTVSIKPSVMKLPPRDEQPVIMAGLGTGMAPFRAFIEERAYRKSQGINVGPMVLYFGSRYRSMEYLYGEELEAYHAEGLLTYLRLAFSRDQKHKIYIQHKMKEDSELLHQFLLENEGWFYLCGPTWPVPDVKDAIVNSFVTTGGMTEGEASSWVDKLKDLERYILEVY